MSTIIPTNGHLEVRPIKEETFIATTDALYEEKGEVISIDSQLADENDSYFSYPFKVGDVVYCDSYLIAKFIDGEGIEHYLIKASDVRAYESVSKQ